MAYLEKEEQEKIKKFLEENGMSQVTIELWLLDKGYSVMKTEYFEDMKDTLHNEVGDDGWKMDWDS